MYTILLTKDTYINIGQKKETPEESNNGTGTSTEADGSSTPQAELSRQVCAGSSNLESRWTVIVDAPFLWKQTLFSTIKPSLKSFLRRNTKK